MAALARRHRRAFACGDREGPCRLLATVVSARDVATRRVSEVLPELESLWMERVAHVVETGEPVRCTDYSGDPDCWVEISLSRIDGVEGVRVGCLLKDVTKSKRNEARLRQLADQLTEEDERKSAFLATLAHELRNPLAPVRHRLELLRGASAEKGERHDG